MSNRYSLRDFNPYIIRSPREREKKKKRTKFTVNIKTVQVAVFLVWDRQENDEEKYDI